MEKRISVNLALGLVIVLMASSCSIFKGSKKYKLTENGLPYRFIEHNKKSPQPAIGKIMSLDITYGTGDTVLFNSKDVPTGVFRIPMLESAFAGDFYEMMNLMHIGDSAQFVLKAEPFFTQTAGYRQVPPEAEGIDKLTFNVRLVSAMTQEELKAEEQAKIEELKNNEPDRIEEYLTENNITTQPTESGLYVLITEEGTGDKPEKGQKVKVHYTGTLLNGKKFDSSLDRGQPFEFPIGQGRVIKGWDEGIAMLNVGSKATLIIPSKLAYGERGAGRDIPPYAPLIFEVELIDVVK
jgi:FKBP-type peptidyl-prolyl cis-trans isomerase